MMTIQPEIWRAALLMLKSYGAEASAQAALQAAQCFVRGDTTKMMGWQRVVDAIVVLDSHHPAAGSTVH
jgi:hypothetical protein